MATLNPSPVYIYDDDHITCRANAAIIGRRFVKVAAAGGLGNKVSVTPAGAGDYIIGVAMGDQATVGGDVPVFCDGVVGVTGSGAITQGNLISAGAAGVAVVATAASQAGSTPFAFTPATKVVGIATADAIDGAVVPVLLLGL